MKYRRLGKTGIQVSEIGFGAWGIGGLTKGATSYGKTNDNESKRALQVAFDRGITFFDTSNVYGDGHSEELIGEVFQRNRDRIIIASKAGFEEHNGPQDFSRHHLNSSLERSLKRLRTDYLDLFQLHSPNLRFFNEDSDVIETLIELKKTGKIRAFGISAKSPGDGVFLTEKYNLDSMQINFNLIDQRASQSGLFDLCQKKEVGVIIRTPLCFGFLSGKYSSDHVFDPADHRSIWSEEQRKIWADAYTFFLDVIKKYPNQTNTQAALRFCLSYDPVSTVIPGMLSEKEVIENIEASNIGLFERGDLYKLEEIFKNHEFFIKEKSPYQFK